MTCRSGPDGWKGTRTAAVLTMDHRQLLLSRVASYCRASQPALAEQSRVCQRCLGRPRAKDTRYHQSGVLPEPPATYELDPLTPE